MKLPPTDLLNGQYGKYFWEYIKLNIPADMATNLEGMIKLNGAAETLRCFKLSIKHEVFLKMAEQAFLYVQDSNLQVVPNN